MSNGELEDLQVRLTHQELAIDALSASVVRQDQLIASLRDEIDVLKRLLRELRPSPIDGVDEPPPPHY